jgi:hypothetical protein
MPCLARRRNHKHVGQQIGVTERLPSGGLFVCAARPPSLFGHGMDLGNVAPWELQDSRFTLIRFVGFDQDYCSRGLCFSQCFAEIRDLISHRFATVGIG